MLVTFLIALVCSILAFVGGFVTASVSLNRTWVKTLDAVNLYWTQQVQMVVATFMKQQADDAPQKDDTDAAN